MVRAVPISEEKFSKIFNASPFPITITTLKDGRCIDVNSAYLMLFGFTREQVIGKTALELNIWHETADRANIREMVKREGHIHNQEIKFRLPDGSYGIGYLSADTIEIDGEECVISALKDITDYKRAEIKMRESEARFYTIFERAGIGVSLTDLKGRVLQCNPAMCKMFGFTEEELLGKSFWDLTPIKDMEIEAKLYDELFTKKRDYLQLEKSYIKKDGSLMPGRLTASLVWLDEQARYAIGMVEDITEQKKAEDALRNERNFISTVLETSAAVVVVLNADGNIVQFNKALQDMTGYTLEEVKGRPFWEIFLQPEYQEPIKNTFADLDRSQLPLKHDDQLVSKDGNTRMIAWSNTAIFNPDGTVAYGIATGIDVTERKRAQDALLKAHDELEQKVEERTQSLEETNAALKVLLKQREEDRKELEEKILANVKNLISPIIGKLQQTRLDNNQMSYVEIIESNLNEIISPFALSLSSRYLSFSPTEIHVAGLIKEGKTSKEIAEILSVSPSAIEFHRKNIRKKLGIKNKKVNLQTNLIALKNQ